jgi:TetR/AcrR family transcriptional repressor of lmrAB and yxaGH operons
MKKNANTKRRLIEAAAYLIHRRGYHATGLAEILAHAEAPKGVLYHHFPRGKPALGAAAIAFSTKVFSAQVDAAAAKTRSVQSFVKALADLTKEDLLTTDYVAGCPLVTTALETTPVDPDLTEACREGFEEWIGVIAAGLIEKGMSPKRASDLAEIILSTLEGAQALARTRKDATVIDRAGKTLAALADAAR